MKKFKFSVNDLALQAMIAALYVAITYVLYPLSFGTPQIRISEFMLILVFFNKKHSIGLLVGCAVVNLLGPFALVDMIVGTFASGLSIYLMLKTPNRLFAFVWPAIINAIIIGAQINFFWEVPLLVGIPEVFIGEFLATFIPAIFLLKPLLKNETMQRLFA